MVIVTVIFEFTKFEIHFQKDVFEMAQDLPLFGALHDLHVYAFTCVNLTTSEQEELDEDRRLSDVKPFLQILRLVEREGDMASKQLNAQIGLLIGKGETIFLKSIRFFLDMI